MHKFLRQISLYLLITIILVMVIQGMYQSIDSVKQLTYTELDLLIKNNKVDTAFLIGEQSIEGTLKDGTEFKTMIPSGKWLRLATCS